MAFVQSSSRVLQFEQCPKCAEEGRDVSKDNLAIYDDGHKYCYGGHGLISFIKEEFLLDQYTYEYLPWRGISKETMQRYDVKTKIDAEGKPISIGFKYPNDTYKVRLLDKKEFYTVGDISQGGLFGRNLFAAGSHKYVTITEGEVDALSLHEVLGSPVVSVQSGTTAARDCSSVVDRAWLNAHERIYLAFDADEQGRRALREVSKLFDNNKLYVVRFTRRKDANEHLSHGEGEDLRRIWWNSKRYQPDHIISDLEDFRTILLGNPKYGAPYPFRTLTDMTYGIRTAESVLITAQEGVGKTELMHAIEHKLLTEVPDANIGAIFLEEPKRRHLQALAGISLKKPVHLPDSNVDPAEVYAALSTLVGSSDRLHLYSHFGSSDPEDLLDTIRFLAASRACKYILLDHITMAVSGLAGEDERRALDHLCTKLEMMVKELDFALIVVSHVNDEGRTRGSRYISKVADIRIDMHRDVVNPDPVERNTVYLTVSKSRDVGKTGPAGRYVFDQNTRQYTELGDGQLNQDTNSSVSQNLTTAWEGYASESKVSASASNDNVPPQGQLNQAA